MRIRPAPPITGPESKGLGSTDFQGGALPHPLHSIAPLVEQSYGDIAASSQTSKDASKSLRSRQRTEGGVGLLLRAPARATPAGQQRGASGLSCGVVSSRGESRMPGLPPSKVPGAGPVEPCKGGLQNPCVWKAEPREMGQRPEH